MSLNRRYKLIEGLCKLITALSIGLPACFYLFLPEKIPTHYGINGHPDSFAGKDSIWFLAVLSIITFFGFLKAISLIKNEVKDELKKNAAYQITELIKISCINSVFYMKCLYHTDSSGRL